MSMLKVVNIKFQNYDVYIGRKSIFGNPYTHLPLNKTVAKFQVKTRDESIEKYKEYFEARVANDPEFRQAVLALQGKILGCHCKPLACHGDVIVEWLKNNVE